MKRTTATIGLIGSLLLLVGGIFKFSHWPGANIIITSGATALAVYMFLFIFMKINEVNKTITKTFIALLGATGLFMTLGFIFKYNKWPGASLLITIFIVSYTLSVIASLLQTFEEKDKELRFKYVQYFIWLLGAGIILLFPIIKEVIKRIF